MIEFAIFITSGIICGAIGWAAHGEWLKRAKK